MAENKDHNETEKAAKKSSKSVVLLGDNIKIDSSKRLEYLDRGDIKAFAGKDKKGNRDFFALVCEPHITPRILSASVYQAISNPRIAPLVKRGVLYWPPAKAERYVMVFQNILGKPILKPDESLAMGVSNELILEKVLPPLVSVLLDFRDKDFFHGGVRISNIFDGGAGNLDKVMLGPSIECPSSYLQPVLYETIYRGMAQPNARGRGRQTHDLYALGVVLAVMMRTKDPFEGLGGEEIIKRKLEEGSYAAITGKDRFKGSILELLRGLLQDDDDNRWTIDEVQDWMEGQRLSPKQAAPKKKSDRSISLGGERYYYLATLAMDLWRNPSDAKRIIDDGDLEHWLVRSLGEEDMFENAKNVVETVRLQGQGAGYADRLVAHVSMALDAQAPIKYKKHAVFPEGIGAALAEVIAKKQDVNVLAEILSLGLASAWIKAQYAAGFDPGILANDYDSCVRFLRKSTLGMGIERCLYQLNPQSHCLSDKLSGYCAFSAQEVLLALDDVCQKGGKPTLFIDRHIAAFLSTQDSHYIDDLIPMLNSKEYYKRVLANLRAFSIVQRREKMPALPGLGKAFSELLPAVYERFHDQKLREELVKKVEKHAAVGDLVKILAVVDDPAVSQADLNTFKSAMREYKVLRGEHEELVRRMENKTVYGRGAGYRAAAMVSVGLASIVILGLTFVNFF